MHIGIQMFHSCLRGEWAEIEQKLEEDEIQEFDEEEEIDELHEALDIE